MYTLKELAEKLEVSQATLRRWLKQKKLGGIMVGGRWRFTDKHIETVVREVGAEGVTDK